MQSSKPLVSAIMPTYNRREFIPRAIECFLNQTYQPLELVVLDDGTDPVRDLIPDHPRIIYCYELPKRNHGQKMNRLCELAHGEYCIVWDDDDTYAPDRVARQLQPMLDNPAIQVTGTSTLYYQPHNTDKLYRYVNLTNQKWLAAIAFRKSAWELQRFKEKAYGADLDFLHSIPFDRWHDLNDLTLMVSTLHPSNTAPKHFPNPSFVLVTNEQ